MLIFAPKLLVLILAILIGVHVPDLLRWSQNLAPLIGYQAVPLLGYEKVSSVALFNQPGAGHSVGPHRTDEGVQLVFRSSGDGFIYNPDPMTNALAVYDSTLCGSIMQPNLLLQARWVWAGDHETMCCPQKSGAGRFNKNLIIHCTSALCAAIMVLLFELIRQIFKHLKGRVYAAGDLISAGSKRFRVLDILGEGGQAFLYKVNSGMDIFAAKLSHYKWSEALHLEFNILSKLTHPNIVRVFQQIPRGYIMEHLSTDLCSFIENSITVPPDIRDAISYGMIQAVCYIHSSGIAHLDIKSENVLLTQSLIPKLADFGLAQSFLNSDGSVRLFSGRCGSFHYMPPEMFIQSAPFDMSKSDCWSLGVCLFTMMTGDFPFKGLSDRKILSNQLKQCYNIPPRLVAPVRFDEPYARYMSMVKHLCSADANGRFSAAEALSFYWNQAP